MRFAGPSTGAALGSGILSGAANAQELQIKSELARDTSAMATYSKLVSSGEWEPAPKGSSDGGILRVGNVGFLKKVKGGRVDWDAQKAMSLMTSRKAATDLAREKFEFKKGQPEKSITVQELSSGKRIQIPATDKVPEGYYKIGVVNAPGMAATKTRTQEGRELSVVRTELADVRSRLKAPMFQGFNVLSDEQIESKPALVKLKSKYDELRAEEQSLSREIDGMLGGNQPPVPPPMRKKVVGGMEAPRMRGGRTESKISPKASKEVDKGFEELEKKKPGIIEAMAKFLGYGYEEFKEEYKRRVSKYEAEMARKKVPSVRKRVLKRKKVVVE